jgi:hydrogenase nickel incorporation protein HypB
MVMHALQGLKPVSDSILFIENVGNLVCPAMFDLGEKERVVIISVTEGEDKPIKYPDMFHTSQLCVINKIDLLPYVPFSVEKVKEYARQVNPNLEFIEVSCTSGEGLDKWYHWLKTKVLAPETI